MASLWRKSTSWQPGRKTTSMTKERSFKSGMSQRAVSSQTELEECVPTYPATRRAVTVSAPSYVTTGTIRLSPLKLRTSTCDRNGCVHNPGKRANYVSGEGSLPVGQSRIGCKWSRHSRLGGEKGQQAGDDCACRLRSNNERVMTGGTGLSCAGSQVRTRRCRQVTGVEAERVFESRT